MSLPDPPPVPPPLEHPVDVSVIVPVLDEEAHLVDVLAAMVRQTFPGSIELLLIDGGSKDRSREIIAELAAQDERVQLLDNPQRLIPQALNIGLRRAHGTYVVRMDAHTRYPPDYIELGVARLQAGDDVVQVSGPQLAVGHDRGSELTALALDSPLGVGGAMHRHDGEGVQEWEVDSGFSGVWRRETLLDAGGWDEAFPTDEDCELAYRLKAQGGRSVCITGMAAEYVPRNTVRRLARQYFSYGRSKVRTFHRHPDAMRPSHLLPPGVALTLLAAGVAPRPLRGPARAGAGVYAGTLLTTAVAVGVRTGRPMAAGLPLAWATMHLAYGGGMLLASSREGVPVRAMARAVSRVVAR